MYNVVVTMIYGDPNDEDAELDTLLEYNYKNKQDASDAVDDCLFANDIEGVIADDVFDQLEEDCVCSNKSRIFDTIDGKLNISVAYTRDV